MKKVSFRVRNFDKEQFLTYNIDNDASLDEELMDFLEDEEPAGIVPIIFEEGEEFDTFSYNITDKIHLIDLSNQEINAEMVLRVFHSLVLTLINMAEYRVPLSYLVLNRNYIYVDSDYRIEFICIPVEEMQEETDVNMFLRNLVASLRFEPSENGDYVAKMLTYINTPEGFQLRNMVSLIEELMEQMDVEIPESALDIYVDYQEVEDAPVEEAPVMAEGEPAEEESVMEEEESVEDAPVMEEEEPEEEPALEEEEPVEEAPVMEEEEPEEEPALEEEEPVEEAPVMEEEEPEEEPALEEGEPVEEAPVMEEEEPEEEPDLEEEEPVEEAPVMEEEKPEEEPVQKKLKFKTKEATVTGVVIEDELDEFLAEKEKEDQLAQREESGLKIKKNIKVSRATVVQSTREDDAADTKDGQEAEPSEKSGQNAEGKAEASSQNAEAAGAAKAAAVPKASPYLIRVNTDERVMVNKQTFKLGKASMGVDYVIKDNAAISRVHAIITCKDGTYYIQDNKSTNHTFVNGKILQDEQLEPLTNDCNVKLGDEEFVFKLP